MAARGKAAAFDAWMARGGTPFKHSGRFKKGPFKGKDYNEAKQQFEGIWSSSSDALKEKYASRSQKSDFAPSERMGTPAPQPNGVDRRTNDQINRDNTRSRILQQGGAYGTPGEQALKEYDARTAAKPTPPPAKAPEGSSFAELTKAPAIPAGGVNSVGDGVFTGGKVSDPNYKFGYDPRADLEAVANGVHGRGFAPNAPTAQPVVSTADMKREDEARVASMPVPAVSPTPAPAGTMPAQGTPVTAGMSIDERMHAEGKTRMGGVPVNKAPPTPQPGQTATTPVRPNRPSDDFTAGPGKEQVGVVQGRPTYAPKVAAITATPQQVAGAQRVMESTGMTPMQPRTMATPAPARSTVAGVRQNDPDIIRKDNVAAANYQSSFTGGNPSDAQFDAAKSGQKALYDNASSQDQAKLVANSLKRSSALPTTVNAPRATVVPGVQPARPSFARR